MCNPIGIVQKTKLKEAFIYVGHPSDSCGSRTDRLCNVLHYDTLGRIESYDLYNVAKRKLSVSYYNYYRGNSLDGVREQTILPSGEIYEDRIPGQNEIFEFNHMIYSIKYKSSYTYLENGLFSVIVDTNVEKQEVEAILRFEYTYR
jgi:hypothetical protein